MQNDVCVRQSLIVAAKLTTWYVETRDLVVKDVNDLLRRGAGCTFGPKALTYCHPPASASTMRYAEPQRKLPPFPWTPGCRKLQKAREHG
jgi:hypothetical protein